MKLLGDCCGSQADMSMEYVYCANGFGFALTIMPFCFGNNSCTIHGTVFALPISKVSKLLCSDLRFRVLVYGLDLGLMGQV